MMRVTNIIAIVFLFVVHVSTFSLADSPKYEIDPNFQSNVLESIARRDALRTGEFDYTIEKKPAESNSITFYQRGTYLFDLDNAATMHTFERAEREDGDSRAIKDIEFKKGGMLVSKEDYFVFLLGKDTGIEPAIGPERFSTTKSPFDFRAFGFAYWGDLYANKGADEVLAGYFTWPDPLVLKRTDDLVEYNSLGNMFTMDIRRDYWITKHELILQDYIRSKDGKWEKGKKNLVTGCDMQLVQLNGHWVPGSVLYRSSSGGTIQYDLKWKSLNVPIASERTSRGEFMSRMGRPVK